MTEPTAASHGTASGDPAPAAPFVPFAMTVCGLDELYGHCEAGVTHVLSIMDPGRESHEAFGSYGTHVRLDLRFEDIVEDLPGRSPPKPVHVDRLLAFGRDIVDTGPERAHLLVHCHAGISRSTASLMLILAQARPDRPPAEALAEVVRIRPVAWPNLRLLEMDDAALGLGGGLVKAAFEHYRRVASGQPDRIRGLREVGRGREVAHLP